MKQHRCIDFHSMAIHAAVDCDVLEAPKDGQVHVTGASFGAIAQYRCIPGFQLVGSANRTCLENGQWSGTEPLCERESAHSLTPVTRR